MNAAAAAAEILRSKKYSSLNYELTERICVEMLTKYKKPSDAIKAAKRELHIIHGIYVSAECAKKAAELISGYSGGNMAADRGFSLRLMGLHSSVRERVENADEIYGFIGKYIDGKSWVADAGCGYSPFALPFLPILPEKYTAYDIDEHAAEAINAYFAAAGLCGYSARILDASAENIGKYDVLLMLKLFPVLEHQKKGRGFDFLINSDFQTGVVSFPLKSMSGREKGMGEFYGSRFEAELPPTLKITEKAAFSNEMLYIVQR